MDNSLFVMISVDIKIGLSERCLVNSLTCILSQALRNCLRISNIYEGNSNKKKNRSN